jgi:hypothetical protein
MAIHIPRCDAAIHNAVTPGSCVMLQDRELVYAGPLAKMPEAEGRVVLLSASDFARLTAHLDRKAS